MRNSTAASVAKDVAPTNSPLPARGATVSLATVTVTPNTHQPSHGISISRSARMAKKPLLPDIPVPSRGATISGAKRNANVEVIPTDLVPCTVGKSLDHFRGDAQRSPVERPLSHSIGRLAEVHRSRLTFITAKVKIELQIKSLQRVLHARRGCEKATHATCSGVYKIEHPDIIALRDAALAPLEANCASRLAEMTLLAKGLPPRVLDFQRGARGFGLPSLAQVVGEAGDLSGYANPAKLWQRMGVGRGPDQDGVQSTRYQGRSPRRAAIMHVIAVNFVKAGGPYRELYDRAKAHEAAKPTCGTFACAGLEHCKPIHVHKRALRKVAKELLKHLWLAWREAVRT